MLVLLITVCQPQVRVFDVNRGGLSHHSRELSEYKEQQATLRIFKCHHGRVKRIVTENSPDYFLTVAEVSQCIFALKTPFNPALLSRMGLLDNTT
jgi:hypothetical protein